MPGLVDSETGKKDDAAYEVAVHGDPQVLVQFCDGACSVRPSEFGLVDCQLSGDSVAWLMALYGRISWE